MRFELSRVQRGIEKLYRVETDLDIGDFLIDSATRDAAGLSRHSREQLLLHQSGEVGVFICESVLRNLGENDPGIRVDDSNFGDFLLAVEGVSHFVYLAWRAQADRQVSGLELELQAEVDKYVTLLLAAENVELDLARRIRQRLFHEFEYEPDLDPTERERYARANEAARRYATHLESTYISGGRTGDMLTELRRYYRLPIAAKLRGV